MAKPTHTLYVKKTDASRGRKVGVGWMNDKGWISIRLDPCTQLTDRDDVYINLYPRTEYPKCDTGVDSSDVDPGDPPDYMDETPPLEEP